MKTTISLMISIFLLLAGSLKPCTIFSAKDKKGNMWAGNNEDGIFKFSWRMHVVSATDSSYGYLCFTEGNSADDFIQGGVNDAGLFFDGNSVPPTEYKNFDKKKDFPGGGTEMIRYILKKCKTVQEVLKLFEIYRLPGNEGGQIHFADKYGNLGIIVADSMWITRTSYQVSTNYNLCHANKDNINCWRFPIAEKILKSREAGLETFRDICDSTSQKKGPSTIYSNIHNLSSGDIWFYYAMDYKHPYKTTLKEMLKGGTRSFYVYELFPKSPLVATYTAYNSKGIDYGLKTLEDYHLSSDNNYSCLRLLSNDLIINNIDFRAYPFLVEIFKLKIVPDSFLEVINAIVLFNSEQKDSALKIIKNYVKNNPEKSFGKMTLAQMNGTFQENANHKFELAGYENAKSVFIKGFDPPAIRYFLIKKDGKWIGEFNLTPDEYKYYFLVDGNRVLDPQNHDIITKEGKEFSRLVIK